MIYPLIASRRRRRFLEWAIVIPIAIGVLWGMYETSDVPADGSLGPRHYVDVPLRADDPHFLCPMDHPQAGDIVVGGVYDRDGLTVRCWDGLQ